MAILDSPFWLVKSSRVSPNGPYKALLLETYAGWYWLMPKSSYARAYTRPAMGCPFSSHFFLSPA